MKKILVLPYHLQSTFKDLEYLSEGILEELIFRITSVDRLNTMSRSTSLYLKNNPAPHSEIQLRFDVDYVLEGSITYKENQCFLISQLYDASNEVLVLTSKKEFQLEKWTTPLEGLTGEISEAILGKKKAIEIIDKDPSRAREYYQQGLYHWNRFTFQEIRLGITFFKRAIKENPDFSLAHAAMADCYGIIGLMGYDNPKIAFKQAKSAVEKALKLNNKRSESYVSAAFINIFYEHDFIKSKLNLEQALRLNKHNVKAHHFFAMHYIHTSDIHNAEKHSLLTLKLDALALPHYAMITRIYIYQRRFKDALDYANIGLGINAQTIPLVELRGTIKLFSGNIESAIEDFKRCIDSDEENPKYYANLAYAYAKLGFYEESRSIEGQLNELVINKDTGYFDYAMAIVKLGHSDIKGFLNHIEKAATLDLGILGGELLYNPLFSEVKKNARIQNLLHKLNPLESRNNFNKTKKPSAIIKLISQTNETITLDPQDISFIAANDNYCTIYWQESGVLTKRMLRVTLKNIEDQLHAFSYIVRCHKSYMINLNEDVKITGNAREAHFESSYLPVRIPISRTKKSSIQTFFDSEEQNF